MRDIVHELDGLAIGMATPSLARDTVSDAAREIERLRRMVRAVLDMFEARPDMLALVGVKEGLVIADLTTALKD